MDGILFVAGLIAGVSIVGLRSHGVMEAPSAWLGLTIVAASAWYVFT